MCSLSCRHPETRHWHLYNTGTGARCLEKTDRQLVCAQLVVVHNPSLPGLKTSRSSQALTSWHSVCSAKAQWWHQAFQGCGEMQNPFLLPLLGKLLVGGSSWSFWAAAVLEELRSDVFFLMFSLHHWPAGGISHIFREKENKVGGLGLGQKIVLEGFLKTLLLFLQ